MAQDFHLSLSGGELLLPTPLRLVLLRTSLLLAQLLSARSRPVEEGTRVLVRSQGVCSCLHSRVT